MPRAVRIPGMKALLLLPGLLFLAACGPEVPGSSSAPVEVGDDGADIVPSSAGISAYVARGDYQTWAAEAGVHPATKTSPHGRVRVFFNRTALAALKEGRASLPVGAMLVKELYGSGSNTLAGYAAMVKSAEHSWTWWEAFLPDLQSPAAYGVDLPGCRGCHSGPSHVDQVLSSAP